MDNQEDRIAVLEAKVETLEMLLMQLRAELQSAFQRRFYETPEPMGSSAALWMVDRQGEINRHFSPPAGHIFCYGQEAVEDLRRHGFGV